MTGLRVLAWESCFLSVKCGRTILHCIVRSAETMESMHASRARQWSLTLVHPDRLLMSV